MAKKTTTNKKSSCLESGPSLGLAVNLNEERNTSEQFKIDSVKVRMYCLGTGDCFVLKFFAGPVEKFTMMIDCGSCRGDAQDFAPYIDNLITYIRGDQGTGVLDLLVVTHEHEDHVNGFAKCFNLFEKLIINEAWFAWTENPNDPTGSAKQLKQKEMQLKQGFENALIELQRRKSSLSTDVKDEFYRLDIEESNQAFLDGLQTLAEINLGEVPDAKKPLAGMTQIKDKLQKQKIKREYLLPGELRKVKGAEGVNFYVLGPPLAREAIYKNGKEGKDIYQKRLRQSILAAEAFQSLDNPTQNPDLPFLHEYVLDITPELPFACPPYGNQCQTLIESYKNEAWRKIDNDWLSSAGTLAIRLNSHINNTSLALAIELESSGKVLLFPGDAEFGSWESWHSIDRWNGKGKNGKHLVEDLLNRTVFYKVSHHMSYNGTALRQGIMMMDSPEFAAMATLDRKRIANKWKSTMPNKFLLEELLRRSQGKVFIMDEEEIDNAPSKTFDPTTLGKDVYEEGLSTDGASVIYKQYTVY